MDGPMVSISGEGGGERDYGGRAGKFVYRTMLAVSSGVDTRSPSSWAPLTSKQKKRAMVAHEWWNTLVVEITYCALIKHPSSCMDAEH